MKYILKKHSDFIHDKKDLIGYSDFTYDKGIWSFVKHYNLIGNRYHDYDEELNDICQYFKDVIVPNGIPSIEYLVHKLNLKSVGFNRYQLYTSTEDANFCIRFVNDEYAKHLMYVHMYAK